MIIGYSVLYINENTNVKDILWEKRVIYTWEKAVQKANEIANKEVQRWDNSFIICLIQRNSQNDCNLNNNTLAFKIEKREQGNIGEVYIITVYDND